MKKNTTISERLSQMIDYLKISTNVFAKNIGYSRSQAIYDVISGKSKPSFDFFEKLYNSEYSEKFNPEWIIKGEGEMLKDVNKLQTSIIEFDNRERVMLDLQIKALESENILQSKAIELYKELNNELKFRINTLEQELSTLKQAPKDPIIYKNVAEPAPELITEKHK